MGQEPFARSCTLAVVGAGPAGLAAALAAANEGIATVLIGPAATGASDSRTSALFQGAIRMLEALGVWPAIRLEAAPIAAIRIIDDTGRLLRAPDALFRAAEIGSEPFGWNIPNRVLTAALEAAAARQPGLTRCMALVRDVVLADDAVVLTLEDGADIRTQLAAAADGRHSRLRAAAGIKTVTWQHPQTAIVCNFKHSRPHQGVSTELHRPAGPLTTVPLPGNASSLVWAETPREAGRLMALCPDDFRGEIDARLQGLLGEITEASRPSQFPLSGLTASRFAARRVVLIGEAGHVVPPIGAQGLNLGLRDAATLADVLQEPGAAEDAGHPRLLAAYDRRRRLDVASRSFAVELLNRTLISPFLPAQALRGLGIAALNTIIPLRHRVMREGMAPERGLPRLMRANSAKAGQTP